MVSVGGGVALAEQWGQAPSEVIALHGWGRTLNDFKPSLGGMRTTSVDLPGFGGSAPPPTSVGSRWYAEQLLSLLDPTHPKVLVGHSFGGRVAVHMAQLMPSGVAGVALTGAPLVRTTTPPKPKTTVRLAKALHARGLLPESVMEKLRQRHGSADYRAAQGVMRQVLVTVLHEDYTEQLRALKCPVELVWGQLDTAAPPAVANAIAGMAPQANVTILPNEGHNLSGTMGDALAAAVQRILDSRTDTSTEPPA